MNGVRIRLSTLLSYGREASLDCGGLTPLWHPPA